MREREPLGRTTVAISISEPTGMDALGMGKEHLDDAMAEVARHLLALGARLLYGGDLRPGGFTRLLFDLVCRHRRNAELGDGRVGVANYLAWPVHASLPAADLRKLAGDLEGTADLVLLEQDGVPLPAASRLGIAARPVGDGDWAGGLTAMRRTMTAACNARIVLGGRVAGYKGSMPGIGEEALLAIEAGQPLYVLGGFGGCAQDIARDLKLGGGRRRASSTWPGREQFARYSYRSLANGLTREENRIVASTPFVDQAIALVLRGLLIVRKGEA